MKNPKEIIYLTIGLCIVIVLDATLKDELLDSGSDFTVEVQTSENLFFDFVGLCADAFDFWGILLLACVIVYEIYPKKGLEVILLFEGGKSLVVLLKDLYADPRPYWYDSDVDAFVCTSGFGNPSGHALGASLGLLLLAYHGIKGSQWKYFICAGLVLVVMFARVYLGVHTYSQTIYGAYLGVFLFMLDFLNRKKAKETVEFLVRKDGIILLHLFSAFFVGLIWILAVVRNPDWENEYTANINDECDESVDESDIMNTEVEKAAIIFLMPGCALGYYFSLFSLGAWWGGDSQKNRILRGLVLFVVIGVFYTIIRICRTVTPYYGNVFIFAACVYFIGLSIFYFVPLVSSKFGWNNENPAREPGSETDDPPEDQNLLQE